MTGIIKIDEYSKTPKYKQIINSVIAGLEKGVLPVDTKLPSVNRLLIEFDISRDTVVKAYDALKDMGIIDSIPGKGYYIKSANFRQEVKIFLLFNKLSPHKKIIYDSFTATLGDRAAIDFYIYNNNYRLFKELILSHQKQNYTHWVIIPHFVDGGEDAYKLINDLPKEKLLILDKRIEGVTGEYAVVYQDFERDIYCALTEVKDLLKKYRTLNIIFPTDGYHPKEIVSGFEMFCTEYAFDFEIVTDIEAKTIRKNEAYINLMEDHLVALIKSIKKQGLKAGQDVGIISYNETPLKEILLDGITVISTDFKKLGQTAAELILQNKKEVIANPFHLFLRNSL